MATLDTIVLYALLTEAMYYLGARALITSWLWSRYPRKLALFMDCPACSGFWYGILVAATFRFPAFSISGDAWYLPPVIGLCSMVWTPMVAAVMEMSFARVGSTVPDPTEDGAGG